MMKKGIKVKANDPNQASWDCLIDQIVLGNVIPVICPEILMAGDMKPFVNPHQVLLDTFSEYFELLYLRNQHLLIIIFMIHNME